MTKRHNAKYKIDRQLGENLWGRAKSPFNKRKSAPGQHGTTRSKRSDYGIQLRAKQKLKKYYANLGEKQFFNIFSEAERRRGDTGTILVVLLERRLDAVLYRACLMPTFPSARQIIGHGHVLVNGKRVNIPSYRVKIGDEITLRKEVHKNQLVLQATQTGERDVPDYISADHEAMKAVYLRDPEFSEVPYPTSMSPNLVVEFYSR